MATAGLQASHGSKGEEGAVLRRQRLYLAMGGLLAIALVDLFVNGWDIIRDFFLSFHGAILPL